MKSTLKSRLLIDFSPLQLNSVHDSEHRKLHPAKSIKPHTIPASVYLLGNQPTFVIDPDDADVVHTTQTQSQLNPNSRC